jgi:ketosteroid isomerase-like protein
MSEGHQQDLRGGFRHVFTVRDGRLTSGRDFVDTYALAGQT